MGIKELQELKTDMSEFEKSVDKCNGVGAVGNLFFVINNLPYLRSPERAKKLEEIQSLARKFENNCVCVKIKDEKLSYDTELLHIDPNLKEGFDKAKNILLKGAENCNCPAILAASSAFLLTLWKENDEIIRRGKYETWDRKTWNKKDRDDDEQILDAIYKYPALFENWDGRCICHKKGTKTYSDAGGRYRK